MTESITLKKLINVDINGDDFEIDIEISCDPCENCQEESDEE